MGGMEKATARAVREKRVCAAYRTLHEMPEYGDRLPCTKQFICEELDKLGIPYTFGKDNDGIVAQIEGVKPGNTIAFRADMDALHIQEATGLPYASKNPGLMHACGHDAHVAMLLGAAEILSRQRRELCGNVRLLFEAGEESSVGALHLIADGAMENVDAVFGLHIGTISGKEIPSGTFVVLPGPVSASKDSFTIEIQGLGGHGAFPSETVDPIRIAAHVITAVQSIVSMELPTGTGAVITFGSICGGKDNNSISDRVVLEGTTRTQNEDTRQYVGRRIREIMQTIPPAFGGSGNCDIRRGSNPVVNDPTLTQLAAEAIGKALGRDRVKTVLDKALMGSDDFARLTAFAPGVYFFLSSSNPALHTDQPHHSPWFAVDENVLYSGAEATAAIAVEYLSRAGGR